jgi:hypothetical protein
VNDGSSSRRGPLRGSLRTATLSPRVRSAVRRFVRLLACGCPPKEIEMEVARTCGRTPRSRPFAAHHRHPGNARRVLTLWLSDPAYLDLRGRPRRLPLRGARLSIETLARRVDPKLNVSQVLRYLQDREEVIRVRSRYVPRNREQILRDRDPSLPVSAIGPLKNRLGQLSSRLLARLDVEMQRLGKTRRKRQRRMRVGVGIRRFQEDRPVARGRRRPMVKRHGKSRER